MKIIIILKGEMLNLYLEDSAAVKNVDIASAKDRKHWFALSIQMHGWGGGGRGAGNQKECLFISLGKA